MHIEIAGLCVSHYSRLQRHGFSTRKCAVCSFPIYGFGMAYRKFCSRLCARIGRLAANRAGRKRQAQRRLEWKRKNYNPEKERERRKRYLASPAALERKRASDRARTRSRRAATKGVKAIETFDPLDVLARDDWTCQMCQKRLSERKRGSFDDDAPELDHIVPLAAGGDHSRRNTQCLCRKCNLQKGASPFGQMLLVG